MITLFTRTGYMVHIWYPAKCKVIKATHLFDTEGEQHMMYGTEDLYHKEYYPGEIPNPKYGTWHFEKCCPRNQVSKKIRLKNPLVEIRM